MAGIALDRADAALAAYESLAPFYDRFTAGYEYEGWLAALEGLAKRHGLEGRRLLDVACGTGKSFAPMVARGYEVSACDISPRMVALARRRLPAPGHAFTADMRALPSGGEFDFVTCLDDAVNYLLDGDDLRAAFASMAGAMRDGAVLVFDVNALSTYRGQFASEFVVETPGAVFCWRGEAESSTVPGSVCTTTIDVFAAERDGRFSRTSSRHLQRHHPRERIEAALRDAGLRCVAVHGQLPGGRIQATADEARHPKVVYVARKEAR